MSEPNRLEVCPIQDLPEGERIIVEAGRASIGVFNIEGEYYAIANTCRHQQGPLCEGEVSPIIEAEYTEPGTHVDEYYSDEHMVVCPWHQWAYSLESGEHVGDSDISVPTYDVVEDDDMLYIDLG